MGRESLSSKKQRKSTRKSLIFVFTLVSIFVLQTDGYAVTKYQGIQPGKTTKDEVSGILGEPAKEIDPSTYEYPPQTGTEKIIIEYRMTEPTPVADKIDVYFLKLVAKSALAKQMKLPENPDSKREDSEGKLQEYYGSTKSLILTYKGKATKSGIKTISFLSRERFESTPKEVAENPEGTKPTTANTDTTTGEKTEIAKLTPEAKQHLQQGMTYVSLAQSSPKKASENYENALLEFSRAIELYPNYAEAYSNRGVAYIQQKKFNKALEDLKKAAELKPEDPIIHYNLAALHSLQNQLDLALEELDKSLKYGFNNYDALKPSGTNSDPDLKNLRKHEEFRKVLEKHKVFILK